MTGEHLPLKAIHHVELLVGNAKQAAYFYRHAFGFSQLAYAGPETGLKDQASYVLYQGDIRLVVSTPLSPERSDGRASATARRRRAGHRLSGRRRRCLLSARPCSARRTRGAGALRPQRRVRPHSAGEDPGLWRHAALVHFDGRLQRAVFAGLPGPPPTGSPGAGSSGSTTSWATSKTAG